MSSLREEIFNELEKYRFFWTSKFVMDDTYTLEHARDTILKLIEKRIDSLKREESGGHCGDFVDALNRVKELLE